MSDRRLREPDAGRMHVPGVRYLCVPRDVAEAMAVEARVSERLQIVAWLRWEAGGRELAGEPSCV